MRYSLLVNKGADVNVFNADNFTPLMLAGQKNYPEIVEVLIRAGAQELTDQQEHLLQQADGNEFAA